MVARKRQPDKRKKRTNDIKRGIVVFVEGQTEKVFFDNLIKHLIGTSAEVPINVILVKNIKGIGKYGTKAPNKFKNEILRDNPHTVFTVFCAYDYDVFEHAQKPPVKWKKVEKQLKDYGAKRVVHIVAKRTIEDWFMIDVEGIGNYLGIRNVNSIKGKTGFEGIQALFKKKNKIYQKGYYTEKFIPFLNLDLIYKRQKSQLEPLRKGLFDN